MKHLRKIGYMAIGAVLALSITFLAIPALAASVTKQLSVTYNNIKIIVDGSLITPKDAAGNAVDPFISGGTTYLPVRAIGEALGKTVTWDGATQTVYVGAVPGKTLYMTDVVPAYENSNAYNYKEYSAAKSGGADSFTMGGTKYTNGFTLYQQQTWAIYNLNGSYTNISATLSHVDGTASSTGSYYENGAVQVFCDGVLREEFPISATMYPTNISINVTGVLQLKIAYKQGNFLDGFDVAGTYGFGDPIIR
jgi:hypothetical protein